MSERDPYVYPNTSILKNKLDFKDDTLLEKAEIALVSAETLRIFPSGQFDYSHFKSVHQHLFKSLYTWAGQERTVNISKGHSSFALAPYIEPSMNKVLNDLKKENLLRGLSQSDFSERLAYYFGEINSIHPFREGNGRTNRAFFALVAQQSGFRIEGEKIEPSEYLDASIQSFNGNLKPLENVFKNALAPIERHVQTQLTPMMLSRSTQQLLDKYIQSYLIQTTKDNSKKTAELSTMATEILSQPDIVHWNKIHGIFSVKLSNEQLQKASHRVQMKSISRNEALGILNHVDCLQKIYQKSQEKNKNQSQGLDY